jgi:hypothetical protein
MTPQTTDNKSTKEDKRIKNNLAQLKRTKRWRKLNPEKVRIGRNKQNHKLTRLGYFVNRRLMKYGLTKDQYEHMIKTQNNKCAICGREETAKLKNGGVRLLSIDHNHTTNKIRELLCSNCNFGIGYFKENSLLLKIASSYIEKWQTNT